MRRRRSKSFSANKIKSFDPVGRSASSWTKWRADQTRRARQNDACETQDADDDSFSVIEVTGGKDDHEFMLYREDEVACVGIDRSAKAINQRLAP